MSSFISLQNIIYPSRELSLTMILLEEWSFIYVEGVDSNKYLQSQLTIDINLLKKTNHTLCAHCDFNGKVSSIMRLFHYHQGYAYIQRKSISELQVKELQKYSIFSKITINRLDNKYLIGFAGLYARSFLLEFFKNMPDENCQVISENNKTILWFSEPSERFLLILSLSDFLCFKKKINKNIFFNNSKQWLLLDIEAGFPVIDYECSKKFMPQSINLEKLGGISFKKGCYYGQENIARMFFKNLNKYFLFFLVGTGDICPEIGSIIETKIENKWYKIGFLLSIVHVKNELIWIQVVLYKNIDIKNVFRIRGFKNIFLSSQK